jgi:O-antigen/teichoic acid export membrane protein
MNKAGLSTVGTGQAKVILKNYFWLGLNFILGMAAGLGANFLNSRFLGVVAFGYLTTLSASAAFVSVINGFGTALLRESARGREDLGELGGVGIILQLFGTLVIVSISMSVGVISLQTPIVIFPAMLIGAAALHMQLALVPSSLFSGKNHMQWQLVNGIAGILMLLGLAVLVKTNLGLLVPAIAIFAGNSITLIGTCALFIRKIGLPCLPTKQLLFSIAGSGLGLSIVAVGQNMHWQIDALLVTWLSTPFQLGIFGAAFRILPIMRNIAGIVGMGMFPVFVAQIHTDFKSFQRTYQGALLFAACLGAIVTLVLLGSAQLIVHVLFPVEFEPSISVLRVYSLLLTPMLIHWVALGALTCLNRIKTMIFLYGIIVLLQVGLAFLLVPGYGALGMAIASVASEIALAILFCFVFSYLYRVSIDTRWLKALASSVVAICVALAYPSSQQLLGTSINLLVLILVWHALGIWGLREIRWLAALVSRQPTETVIT